MTETEVALIFIELTLSFTVTSDSTARESGDEEPLSTWGFIYYV